MVLDQVTLDVLAAHISNHFAVDLNAGRQRLAAFRFHFPTESGVLDDVFLGIGKIVFGEHRANTGTPAALGLQVGSNLWRIHDRYVSTNLTRGIWIEIELGNCPNKMSASPMARSPKSNNSTANLGFEAKLWLAADKLRSNMDAAEYKHVVLGLIFLKYISDAFEEHHAKLMQGSARASRAEIGAPADLFGEGDYAGANPEDPDECKAENVFWVPPAARWTHLQNSAKQPEIGKIVDDAMVAIECDCRTEHGPLRKSKFDNRTSYE